MKKMQTFFLMALSLMLLQSCGESDSVNKGDTAAEHRELINEADDIQEAVTQGRLLSSSSSRDRQGLTASIRDARNALVRLARDPNDRLGIELGYRALKEIEKLRILRGDSGVLSEFYRDLGNVVSAAARRVGVDLRDLVWSQYSYAFSDDLKPFASVTTGATWSTGVSLDKSYVRVRGIRKKNISWLLSPSFDLRNIENPGFQISHNTNVERNDSTPDAFNRVLINKTVFKVLVSTTYNDGDKLDMSEWVDLSAQLGEMPTGVDFHTVDSAVVDLSKYVSEKTTVAIVFNEDTDVVGRHYLSWQLNRFELLGAGNLTGVKPRAAPLNVTEIDGTDLSPFGVVAIDVGAPKWEYFQIGGSPRFAKASARSGVGESWLVSPKYKLVGAEKLALTVKEVVRNPKFGAMEIMISRDYNGEDPNLATWKKLQRRNIGEIPADAWVDVVSGPFDLEEFLGEDVVVGLKFTSLENENHEWEIASLTLSGEGEPIRFNRYPITYKIPGDDRPASDLPSFNFNYGNEGFVSSTVSGTPASFALTSRDGRQYFNISGFRTKSEGVTRLSSPAVELVATDDQILAVKVVQNYNFYDSAAQAKGKLLKIFLRSEDGTQEEELNFTTLPSGSNFDIVESEKLKLSDSWKNKKASLVFEYASGGEVFPQWSLYEASFVYLD